MDHRTCSLAQGLREILSVYRPTEVWIVPQNGWSLYGDKMTMFVAYQYVAHCRVRIWGGLVSHDNRCLVDECTRRFGREFPIHLDKSIQRRNLLVDGKRRRYARRGAVIPQEVNDLTCVSELPAELHDKFTWDKPHAYAAPCSGMFFVPTTTESKQLWAMVTCNDTNYPDKRRSIRVKGELAESLRKLFAPRLSGGIS